MIYLVIYLFIYDIELSKLWMIGTLVVVFLNMITILVFAISNKKYRLGILMFITLMILLNIMNNTINLLKIN